MRSTLSNHVLASAMIVAATFATTTIASATTLDVPFNFTVGGKNCPAGQYQVDRTTNGGIVTLKSRDARQSFSWALQPGNPEPSDTRVVLRFDEKGETHLLQSVQFGPMITPQLDKKIRQVDRTHTRIVEGQ